MIKEIVIGAGLIGLFAGCDYQKPKADTNVEREVSGIFDILKDNRILTDAELANIRGSPNPASYNSLAELKRNAVRSALRPNYNNRRLPRKNLNVNNLAELKDRYKNRQKLRRPYRR